MEDAANDELEIDRVDRTLQNDAVANLPSILLGQRGIHNYALSIVLPSRGLIRRQFEIPIYFEEFIGISAELREEILSFLVLIDSPDPGAWPHCPHRWNQATL